MKSSLLLLLFTLVLYSVGAFAQTVSTINLNSSGMTVSSRVKVPENFVRPPFPQNSFQSFLSNLEIKEEGSSVMKYDGYEKSFKCYSAILKTETDMSKDIMHGEHFIQFLRAQFLFNQEKYDLIRFAYDDGRVMTFEQYAEGARFVMQDSLFIIDTIASVDYSQDNLARYMEDVYHNTTASSISMDTRVLEHGLLSVGDVLVQPGDSHSPGHALMVLDMVVEPESGERLVLYGQGYSPTQDMHILHNPYEQDISPWYRVKEDDFYVTTAQWTFRKKHIRRFRINANAESLSTAYETSEE